MTWGKVAHLRTQPFPFTSRSDHPRLHDRIAALARDWRPERRPAIDGLLREAYGLDLQLAEELERAAAELT